MSQYSLDGYRIAVQARSSKTILVEGPSDAAVLHRLMLECRGEIRSIRPRIDTPEIVRDAGLSTLGAKDRVSHIVDSLSNMHEKIAGLIDREWEGFCTLTRTEVAPRFISPTAGIYKTCGHSIENYLIEIDMYIDYVKRGYPHSYSDEFLQDVGTGFQSIMVFSYAYSVACQQTSVISKCERLLSSVHLSRSANGFELNDVFYGQLRTRGVSNEAIDSFKGYFGRFSSQSIPVTAADLAILKWNSHGHLAQAAIWACLAYAASRNGFSQVDVTEIERGRRNEKLRHFAHMLANDSRYERIPLDELIQWAAA